MGIANGFVSRLLDSPLHGLISGSTDLVRFVGRRSGRTITTPTQYVMAGDELIILVGNARDKLWWRNFMEPRDLEVLVKRNWLPMTGHVVTEQEDPAEAARLLAAYCDRFPHARKDSAAGANNDASGCTFVLCAPRA